MEDLGYVLISTVALILIAVIALGPFELVFSEDEE